MCVCVCVCALLDVVDIREIREVRRDCHPRDLKNCTDELRRMDPSHGFVILFGAEFNLKSLTLFGKRILGSECCVWWW